VDEKQVLREKMFLELKNLEKEEKERRNAVIREKFFSNINFKDANFIMSYVSKPYEVDTWRIIKQSLEMGKKIAVPCVLKGERLMVPALILDHKELSLGPYGVYQPHPDNIRQVDLNQLDLVLVPGIAFDKEGNRLGHGRGYFDRFLKKLPRHVHIMGLAYEFQILPKLPISQKDFPMSSLIYG